MDSEELETRQSGGDAESPELDRGAIALRAVFSLLVALILSVLNSLLGILVIFQLAYSFVTRRVPSARVRELGNDVTAYYYQVLRYLTHNDSRIPFPFSDLPAPLEAGRPAYATDSAPHADDLDDATELSA